MSEKSALKLCGNKARWHRFAVAIVIAGGATSCDLENDHAEDRKTRIAEFPTLAINHTDSHSAPQDQVNTKVEALSEEPAQAIKVARSRFLLGAPIKRVSSATDDPNPVLATRHVPSADGTSTAPARVAETRPSEDDSRVAAINSSWNVVPQLMVSGAVGLQLTPAPPERTGAASSPAPRFEATEVSAKEPPRDPLAVERPEPLPLAIATGASLGNSGAVPDWETGSPINGSANTASSAGTVAPLTQRAELGVPLDKAVLLDERELAAERPVEAQHAVDKGGPRAVQLKHDAPRDTSQAHDSTFSQHYMPTFLDGREIGSLPLRIGADSVVSVHLGTFLSLFSRSMNAEQFERLIISRSAQQYVTLETMKAAGINLRYELSKKRLVLSVG